MVEVTLCPGQSPCVLRHHQHRVMQHCDIGCQPRAPPAPARKLEATWNRCEDEEGGKERRWIPEIDIQKSPVKRNI